MSPVDRLGGYNSGVAVKQPCRVATQGNITLSGEQTIDGVAVVDGDRVWVGNQTDATENGIYIADTGTWVRAQDFNGTGDVVRGTLIKINEGDSLVTTVSDGGSAAILIDGVTAPDAIVGVAQIYVDSADGDLKIKFGDGTVKTITADT